MKTTRNILLGMSLLTGVTQPLAAQTIECAEDEKATAVSGKISNNALQPGTTLGMVQLKVKAHKKMECGILGQGGIGNDGSINFVHTLVCNDEVAHPLTGERQHSQLTLNTSGFANFQLCAPAYPPGSAWGTFQEASAPVPGTGRGIFAGVERGELHIEGEVNCLSAIDMKFSGTVCLKHSH